MKDPRKTNAVDLHIAKKIREYRLGAEMSQETLAEKLGLTFQQIQKYEKAANRVAASRLHKIAKVLDRAITEFFPV